jgi:hypothetical protein
MAVITNLDTLLDTVVSANVNVIAANQAAISAEADAVQTAADVVVTTQKATDAGNSALSAAVSESNASAYKDAASLSALAASTSESKAAASELLADQHRADAEANMNSTIEALAAAQAVYDHFDDRYLGGHATDPLTDNDGHDIVDGAFYWNTTEKSLKLFNQTALAWQSISESSGALLAANNLSDVIDTGIARTNLDVYSTGETTYQISLHNLDTSVHGVGIVVGAIEAQTLTNKTLDDLTNLIGADHVHFKVKNMTGVTIPKGKLLKYFAYEAGDDVIRVAPVTSVNDVAIGMSESDLVHGVVGLAVNTGAVHGINTSALTPNTILYNNGAGWLTATQPSTGLYQACAVALNAKADGTLLVEFTMPTFIASTAQKGIVQLNDTLTSTSVTEALTASQGKVIKDALDIRYTKTEVDALLDGQDAASEISVAPQGNLSSTTVQSALEELQSDINSMLVDVEW